MDNSFLAPLKSEILTSESGEKYLLYRYPSGKHAFLVDMQNNHLIEQELEQEPMNIFPSRYA
ncbi:MAG: hypothetical protein LBV12_07720 [Puniceicoccales bacterium]|jgi:hypothetical protein|nr:hypothetical protein [Puniceicoccales bacterium]